MFQQVFPNCVDVPLMCIEVLPFVVVHIYCLENIIYTAYSDT